MPQGLQCFDETGKMIVDVADRQMQLVHSFNIALGSGTQAADYTYEGITDRTHVAIVREKALGVMSNSMPSHVLQAGCVASIYKPNTVRVSQFVGYTAIDVDIYRYA